MAAIADAFMRQYGVPGLSIAIALRGSFVYEEAFGMADRESAERVTPAHRFRIASISKPITSCAILDLVEQGRLKLEDRVFGRGAILATDYGTLPYNEYLQAITVEHLLTHTVGAWANDGSDPMFRHIGMSVTDLISMTLDSRPPTTPPGRSYAYSNFGYCLLGRVIEIVTGTRYEEHVRRRILARCGISNMIIGSSAFRDRQPLEVRYYGQGRDNPYTIDIRRHDANGGWIASARDLVSFAMRVDGFPAPPDILRADTIARMTTPSTANARYALGWNVNRLNNWWHVGSLAGTETILVRTASGFCWAALTNTRRSNSDMATALDNLVWNMVRSVSRWQ